MEAGNELLKLEELGPEQLGAWVNQLIEKDFSRLVQLLYRLDVSEIKLKKVLEEGAGGDAGALIANLILERIAQSRKTKEMFRPGEDIPDNDKW
jgi:hypothetical protein